MPGHAHQNQQHYFVGNSDASLQLKNQHDLSLELVLQSDWPFFLGKKRQKKSKYPTLGPFCPNLEKQIISTKIRDHHFLASIVP